MVSITGNAIGGGVAVSLNGTERVITQNGSAAFGNLSRGACPIMMLSQHLPKHVGLAAASESRRRKKTIISHLRRRTKSFQVFSSLLTFAKGISSLRLDIYLTDSTFSAAAVLKAMATEALLSTCQAGMASRIATDIRSVLKTNLTFKDFKDFKDFI